MTTNDGPKPVTVEDVQKMLGAMMMEIEVLRRENASLREQLSGKEEPAMTANIRGRE